MTSLHLNFPAEMQILKKAAFEPTKALPANNLILPQAVRH
jgi:hypothetical protein